MVGTAIAGSGQKKRKRAREPVYDEPSVASAFDLTTMKAELKKLSQILATAAEPKADPQYAERKFNKIEVHNKIESFQMTAPDWGPQQCPHGHFCWFNVHKSACFQLVCSTRFCMNFRQNVFRLQKSSFY